ncbi:MAG TPA: hypothetical protein VM100_07235 [Longimicrobiales bacterium]|nr:hypothetical protein [Longimicrobiales bacterium]
MRRAYILALTFFAVCSSAAAQGLQYKMIIKHNAIAGFGEMPAPEMLMSTDGSMMRVDVVMEMPGMAPMRMSTIMDPVTKKMIMLRHDEKAYTEMPVPDVLAHLDTAAIRTAAKNIKQINDSQSRQVIDGRETHRVVMTSDFPPMLPGGLFPKIAEGNRAVIVTEQWIANDPVIAKAFIAMAKFGGSNVVPEELMKATSTGGFAVRSTSLVIQVPKAAAVDAEAVLKAGVQAKGMLMSTTTAISDIKVGPVDPALFRIPSNYKQLQMPSR